MLLKEIEEKTASDKTKHNRLVCARLRLTQRPRTNEKKMIGWLHLHFICLLMIIMWVFVLSLRRIFRMSFFSSSLIDNDQIGVIWINRENTVIFQKKNVCQQLNASILLYRYSSKRLHASNSYDSYECALCSHVSHVNDGDDESIRMKAYFN